MSSVLQFEAVIKINGVNPYVRVTSSDASVLHPNWRKPMPVTVQINDMLSKPWHINIMPIGNGDYYLYLHADVRKASATKVGDLVKVQVTFDSEYIAGPVHPLPEQFAYGLAHNASAAKRWSELSPSRQKEILRYFARLKSSEAVERNIQKAVRVLSGSKERFLGRTWFDENEKNSLQRADMN